MAAPGAFPPARPARYTVGMDSGDELLSKAVEGDKEALASLLQLEAVEMRRRLTGEIPARWRSLLSVEDLLQESYTDAFLGFRDFVPRGPGSFQAWLWTLTRRNLLDAIKLLEAKKRGGDLRRVESDGKGDSFTALIEEIGMAATPSRDAAEKERGAALESALARLPEHYRQVICLYDLEGLSMREVAERLRRSAATVCVLRARALRCLREILGSTSRFFSGTG